MFSFYTEKIKDEIYQRSKFLGEEKSLMNFKDFHKKYFLRVYKNLK